MLATMGGQGQPQILTEMLLRFLDEPARAVLARSGFDLAELPAHSESCGQADVVVVQPDGSLTAASDPRSDGSAAVVHHVRLAAGR